MMTNSTPTASAKSHAVTSCMFTSRRYSDLIITCKGQSFKVRRAVVCLQSNPIAAMVDGKFKEAIIGVIDLPENESSVVEKMIYIMYHGEYSDDRKPTLTKYPTNNPKPQKKGKHHQTEIEKAIITNSPSKTDSTSKSEGAPLINARVYAIAEQYDVPNLKDLAKEKYAEVAPNDWNGSSFVESLKLMFELTPESDRALKDVAMKTAGENAKELIDRADFASLCKENGEIALNVLKASLNADTASKRCPFCSDRNSVSQQGTYTQYYCNQCDRFFN